jgi:competence protein ComEC
MVMSHPDLDHSRGLVFPLEHFSVGRFAYNGRMPSGKTGDDLARAMAELKRKPEVWRAGDVVRVDDENIIEVLHPPKGFEASGENDHSLVLRLMWRGRGMALAPGDLEGPGLRALMDSGADISARLLILPHHGGKSGVTPEFLEHVRPELAVACVGYLNYRRLPHEDVRAALERAGVPLMATGENGQVRVWWAGPDAPLKAQAVLP